MEKRKEQHFQFCQLDEAKELTSLLDFVDSVEFGHKIMYARGELAQKILETYGDIYTQKSSWKNYLTAWGWNNLKLGIEIAIKDRLSCERYKQYKIITNRSDDCIWLVRKELLKK